jgi:hypothetical protein
MKKLLIVLACLGAVAAVFFFVFRKKHQPAVDQEIAKRLIAFVHEGSNGLYHLEMDSLVADVVDSKLIIFNAHLRPDTVLYERQLGSAQAPQDLFDVRIDQFSIDDISPVDFLTAKEINLEKIYLKNPVIQVVHRKQNSNPAEKDTSKTVFQRLQNKVSSIKVDTIRIEDASFTYDNRTKKKTSKIDKLSFLATDFLIAENTQNDTTRFLFSKNCRIRVREYSLQTPDSLYSFKFEDLAIDASKKIMVIDKIRFAPRVSAAVFYKKIGHQQDRFSLAINRVTIQDIGWWSMLGDESLIVKQVLLDKAELDIFNDKSQKADTRSKMGKYPHQLLMKVAFGIRIDTMAIRDMRMSYTELSAKTGDQGTLRFTNINGGLLNVTNDSATILTRPVMRIGVNATFMQEAPLKANFAFNLAKQRSGEFEVSLKLGRLSKEAINRLTVPLGPVQIDELKLNSLNATIKGNNNTATGRLVFQYEDLKVAALKNDGDKVKKKKLLSFIANTFILKSANPIKGKEVRVAYPTFKRDPTKSYFNLVWKTVFTGIKMTAGVNR